MFELFSEMFSYAFLVRAIVVGALVSICAALLGLSMVLKRYSMIGTGLSNVGFASLALATALHMAPLSVAIPIVIAAAFLLLRLSENSKIKGDAAVAIISTGSLAIGVIIISRSTGMNTDVCNYLFGSILAMSKSDVYLSVALSAAVLVLFLLFYNKLFAITFDEAFAKTTGINTGLYNMLIALLTALTIVLGMRMMGALLISSLIIFPALSAMRVFKKFKSVTICSAIISILCFFIGVVISYLYATPTGASVVLVNVIVFVLFWLAGLIPRNRFAAAMIVMGLALPVFMIGCDRAKAADLAGATDAVPANGAAPAANNGVMEIKEKLFIAQVNDIYLNAKDYLGKSIKLEGIFKTEQYEQLGPYYFVLRYGPGCCGTDGNVGFEVKWDKDFAKPYPDDDAWVEATGILRYYYEEFTQYYYLDLSSLAVLDKRGVEFVTQ